MCANGNEVGMLLLGNFEESPPRIAAQLVTPHPHPRRRAKLRGHGLQSIGDFLSICRVG